LNNHDQHGHFEHPDVQFETRDLSAKAVVGFLVVLAIVGILMCLVRWGMYQYLNGYQARHQPRLSPLEVAHAEGRAEAGRAAQRFPSPRLQPDPVADMNKFRSVERDVLNNYGWVDRKAGVVHIPIEQAMDQLIARGLPTRQASSIPSGTGTPGKPTPAQKKQAGQ